MYMEEVGTFALLTLLDSTRFPFRTGNLKRNFVSYDLSGNTKENQYSFKVLDNPRVYYGKILEVAPKIRYRIVKYDSEGVKKYDHRTLPNRHYRYIENIVESEVIPAIEQEFGVKYENK